MSASFTQEHDQLLKQCLPNEGMRWKSRSHILRKSSRDRRVMRALRDRGIRLTISDIQREFCSLVSTATEMARRGEARTAESTYDFVIAIRRRHRLGRHLSKRLFIELFRALVNGRSRYLRRRGTAGNTAGTQPTCQLAAAIDRFLRTAGAFYSDSEIFLQLNEEPVEDA